MLHFNVDKIIPNMPTFKGFKGVESPVKEGVVTFGDLLKQAVSQADSVIARAGEMSRKVATGQVKSIQEVTLAWAESGLVIKMARLVTSKVIEAARTLFQVQV